MNFQSLFVDVLGSLTIVLGVMLLYRWFKSLRNRLQTDHRAASKLHDVATRKVAGGVDDHSDRWNALLKYDDDIRKAAERLKPFGPAWVSALGRDFFALNEDRSYRTNIVDRLVREAKEQQEQERIRKFAQTADGSPCTEASRSVLRAAEAQGFTLEVEGDKTFTLMKGSSKTYL